MTLVHLVRCPAETCGSFQGASSLGGFLQLAAQIPVCKQDLEGQAHRQDVQPRPLRPHPAMAPAKVYTVTATRLMPPTAPGCPAAHQHSQLGGRMWGTTHGQLCPHSQGGTVLPGRKPVASFFLLHGCTSLEAETHSLAIAAAVSPKCSQKEHNNDLITGVLVGSACSFLLIGGGAARLGKWGLLPSGSSGHPDPP